MLYEMNVSEALLQRRTIRKFTQEALNTDDLRKLLEYARLAAYPANLQPLKFAVIQDKETVDKIFPLTKWAG
jgi:nitroreductase